MVILFSGSFKMRERTAVKITLVLNSYHERQNINVLRREFSVTKANNCRNLHMSPRTRQLYSNSSYSKRETRLTLISQKF